MKPNDLSVCESEDLGRGEGGGSSVRFCSHISKQADRKGPLKDERRLRFLFFSVGNQKKVVVYDKSEAFLSCCKKDTTIFVL